MNHRHAEILRASRMIPAGYWTSYGEIGAAATGKRGTHRLVARLAVHDSGFRHAWRVLHADGSIADGWRGHGGGPERCRELLEAEGVRFINGRADPEKKVLADEIELLLASS